MKKILYILLLFTLGARAQNTVTLPNGTASITPQFRKQALSPDSLSRYWVNNGTSWNEWYTATRLLSQLKNNSLFPNRRADSLHSRILAGLDPFTGDLLLGSSGFVKKPNFNHNGFSYWDGSGYLMESTNFFNAANGGVGFVGSSDGTAFSDASLILALRSTTKGFGKPFMTQAQRLAMSIGASYEHYGLQVFQTDGIPGTYTWYNSTIGWKRDLVTGDVPDSATIANNYLRTDTAKKTYQSYITTTYDKSNYTNLSDFTITGTSPTINSATGAIVMTGGTSDMSNYITINGMTNNSRSQDVEVYGRIIDLSGAGIIVAQRKSINTTSGGQLNGYCQYDVVNNTFSLGNVAATASGITVAVGDYFKITMSIRQDVLLSATFEDVTKNQKFSLVDRVAQNNTGDIGIFNYAGNTEINQIRVLEYTNPTANAYTFTDSKFLLPYKQNIPFFLFPLGTVGVFGGQSDKSNEMLAAAPYMIKYMKPSTVYFNYLRNDLTVATPLSNTAKTNYITTVNLFKTAGWKVVHVLPIPEVTIADQSSINTFINGEASFSGDTKIDLAPGFVTANYVTAIHLNEAGARLAANKIIDAGALPKKSNYQPDNYVKSGAYLPLLNQENIFIVPQRFQNVKIGSANSANVEAFTGLFATVTGGSGLYPFTAAANSVWSARGNANADHVFMNNGIVRGYAKGSTGEFTWGYTDGATHASNSSNFNINGKGKFIGFTATGITAGTAGTDSILVKKASDNQFYKITAAYYTTPSGTEVLRNKSISNTNTFSSATGTTADSLAFVSSLKHVSKAIVAGNGLSITQTPNTVTFSATGNPIVEITGTTQTAAANTIYIPHNAALTTISIPNTTVIGSLYQVIGEGAGGWKFQFAVGQTAKGVGSFTTTAGGSISSTDRYCTLTVRLVAANTFVVTTSQGTLTPL